MTYTEYRQHLRETNKDHYTFDKKTGIVTKIDSRSLAEKYPLYCTHGAPRGHLNCHAKEIEKYYTFEELADLQCRQEYKRIFKWKEYLTKELSK